MVRVTKMEVQPDDDFPEDGINMTIINELKARRHLWDSRHKLYKDSVIKRKSWSELARKLGVREPFLKTRWRSLRDRYMKERRREIQMAKTGEVRKNRPWNMMSALDFLTLGVTPSNNLNQNSKQDEDKVEDSELTSQEEIQETFELETSEAVQSLSSQSVSPGTYLIINPDNTIQSLSLPSGFPVTKTRPLRRIEPATSESPRNVNISIPTTTTIAGSSSITTQVGQVQQIQSIKPMPRLTTAPVPTITAKPEASQTLETESSERYFYLSIAKEMENRSTKVRLKMRKIISDALLSLYEEEEQE